MFDVNVLGTLRVTKALLPRSRESGRGTVVVMGSTAGHVVYEGGGGYTAAKHAVTALTGTLRLELCGEPVRVIEIDPGIGAHRRVRADPLRRRRGEGRRRLRGRGGAAGREDIADCVSWCATRPHHVNVDQARVGRSPRPRSTRSTAYCLWRRPSGVVTRGTTNPNRLRRVDRWIAVHCRRAVRPATPGGRPRLRRDPGHRRRAARPAAAAVRRDVRVVGLEIDTVRVADAHRSPRALAHLRPRRLRAAGAASVVVPGVQRAPQYPKRRSGRGAWRGASWSRHSVASRPAPV